MATFASFRDRVSVSNSSSPLSVTARPTSTASGSPLGLTVATTPIAVLRTNATSHSRASGSSVG